MVQMEEYSALKNEIHQCIELEFVAQTTMVTSVIAIFAIAFQLNNMWTLLVSYIPLLCFQATINAKRNGRLKIAAYIQVFHELDDKWEKAIYEVAKELSYRSSLHKSAIIAKFFSKMSSFIFAILTCICSIIMFIVNYGFDLSSRYISILSIIIFINILCLYSVYVLNRQVYYAGKTSKMYIEIMEKIKSQQSTELNQ